VPDAMNGDRITGQMLLARIDRLSQQMLDGFARMDQQFNALPCDARVQITATLQLLANNTSRDLQQLRRDTVKWIGIGCSLTLILSAFNMDLDRLLPVVGKLLGV
jgi:hypothetical protein